MESSSFMILSTGEELICRLDPTPSFTEFKNIKVQVINRNAYDAASDLIQYKVIPLLRSRPFVLANRSLLNRADAFFSTQHASFYESEINELLEYSQPNAVVRNRLETYTSFCLFYPEEAKARGILKSCDAMKRVLEESKDPFFEAPAEAKQANLF